MTRTTVMVSTEALLRLVDGPAMLSKYVRIGDYITDAIILDVHPEVSRWYGYDHPEQMRGRYVSQLHDRECLQQVRRYSVARQLGLTVPETYDMRIHLPNGQHRWMRKQQVRQINDGAEVYWVTQSAPVSAAQAQPAPEIDLPAPVVLEHFLGWGCVADIERLIKDTKASDAAGSSSQLLPPQGSDLVSHRTSLQTLLDTTLGHPDNFESFEISLGELLFRRWVHRCRRCDRRWIGSSAQPKKCTYCKSPYWDKPRQSTPEGKE